MDIASREEVNQTTEFISKNRVANNLSLLDTVSNIAAIARLKRLNWTKHINLVVMYQWFLQVWCWGFQDKCLCNLGHVFWNWNYRRCTMLVLDPTINFFLNVKIQIQNLVWWRYYLEVKVRKTMIKGLIVSGSTDRIATPRGITEDACEKSLDKFTNQDFKDFAVRH